jgi:hypothetical protein
MNNQKKDQTLNSAEKDFSNDGRTSVRNGNDKRKVTFPNSFPSFIIDHPAFHHNF